MAGSAHRRLRTTIAVSVASVVTVSLGLLVGAPVVAATESEESSPPSAEGPTWWAAWVANPDGADVDPGSQSGLTTTDMPETHLRYPQEGQRYLMFPRPSGDQAASIADLSVGGVDLPADLSSLGTYEGDWTDVEHFVYLAPRPNQPYEAYELKGTEELEIALSSTYEMTSGPARFSVSVSPLFLVWLTDDSWKRVHSPAETASLEIPRDVSEAFDEVRRIPIGLDGND